MYELVTEALWKFISLLVFIVLLFHSGPKLLYATTPQRSWRVIVTKLLLDRIKIFQLTPTWFCFTWTITSSTFSKMGLRKATGDISIELSPHTYAKIFYRMFYQILCFVTKSCFAYCSRFWCCTGESGVITSLTYRITMATTSTESHPVKTEWLESHFVKPFQLFWMKSFGQQNTYPKSW